MAMTYQNFASLGVNLNRQKYGPLDISNVFTSDADLKYYLSKGTFTEGVSTYWYKNANDKVVPYPYEGQVIALAIEGEEPQIYKLIKKPDNNFDIKLVGVTDWNQIEGKPDIITYSEGNGITITGDGNQKIISIERDSGSEDFLKIGSNGIKLTGVQNAIDNAVKNISFPEQQPADWEEEDSTAAGYIKNKPDLKANGESIYNGKPQAVKRDFQGTGENRQAIYDTVDKKGSLKGSDNTLVDAPSFSYGANKDYSVDGVTYNAAPLATGAYSAAFGEGIVEQTNRYYGASGQSSFTAGQQCSATGMAGTAFGRVSRATGEGSFSAGEFNDAKSTGGIALGYSNTSEGQGSVALGQNVLTNGQGNISAGYQLVPPSADTDVKGRITLGRYNAQKKNLLLVVGNGDDKGRKNAFEIEENGAVWFSELDTIRNFTEGTIRDKVVTVEGSLIVKPNKALDYAVLNKVGFKQDVSIDEGSHETFNKPMIVSKIEINDSEISIPEDKELGLSLGDKYNYIDFNNKTFVKTVAKIDDFKYTGDGDEIFSRWNPLKDENSNYITISLDELDVSKIGIGYVVYTSYETPVMPKQQYYEHIYPTLIVEEVYPSDAGKQNFAWVRYKRSNQYVLCTYSPLELGGIPSIGTIDYISYCINPEETSLENFEFDNIVNSETITIEGYGYDAEGNKVSVTPISEIEYQIDYSELFNN